MVIGVGGEGKSNLLRKNPSTVQKKIPVAFKKKLSIPYHKDNISLIKKNS
jgi:hypothetical protein